MPYRCSVSDISGNRAGRGRFYATGRAPHFLAAGMAHYELNHFLKVHYAVQSSLDKYQEEMRDVTYGAAHYGDRD